MLQHGLQILRLCQGYAAAYLVLIDELVVKYRCEAVDVVTYC